VDLSSSIWWCRRREHVGVSGRLFWLGLARAGLTVRFWADLRIIHLNIAGVRVKSVISHLTVADLARLISAHGAVRTGPPPIHHPTGLAR
jgi:hypothetical protein